MLDPHKGFIETSADVDVRAPGHTQLVPHSIEAEEALLGALIIDPTQFLDCGYLVRADFYLLNNGYLYDAMKTLFDKHAGYDWLTVTEQLRSTGHLDDIGGEAAVSDLINRTPTSYGAPEYAAIVYRHSVGRQVINETTAITQTAFQNVTSRSGEALVSDAIDRLSAIDASRNVSNGGTSMAVGINKMLDKMTEIEQTGQLAGLKTGLKSLDHLLGGLEDEKFYLLAGRPGMGKSALALQIIYNIAKAGTSVLLFALEMTTASIAARLTSSVCGIPYRDFKRGDIGERWPVINLAAASVANLPITVIDRPALTVANLRSLSQKEMLKHPLGLVVIDHGGLVAPEMASDDPFRGAFQNSMGLMALPKQLGCPVLSLLQLTRAVENSNDKRPQMHHLRGSGTWEENADGIMFLYRDEVYNPDTEYPHMGEIIVAKNRDGETGAASIYSNVALNRFVDLETRTVPL